MTLNGSDLTVRIVASGLEANKFHQQHIHAILNPNDKPSEIPTLAKWDKNHNGMIDDIEGDAAAGAEAVYLTKSPEMENIYSDFPVASSTGKENFKQTYDVSEVLPFLKPLDIRGVELHGMTVDGEYVADLPVAAGLLSRVGGSNSGSAGGNAVPLPPAAWAGGLTMIGVAVTNFAKRKRLQPD